MAAIWGMVHLEQHNLTGSRESMSRPYRERCRLDHISEIQEEDVFMGCGIQYLTACAKSEQLPLYDKDRQCMFTVDGILDNRDMLAAELGLQGHVMPDGKMMYLAYCQWGIDCVRHFRGLYSLAVYNRNEKTLYLAADQVAGRCLYYYVQGSQITFSTLIEPIRVCHPDIEVNKLYLQDYLAAPGLIPNIVSEMTPYDRVYKLNPGCYLRFDRQGKKEIPYWTPELPLEDCRCRTAAEYGSFFRSLYTECVRDAICTTGEVGIAMSSGLDSASAGVLAAEQLNRQDKKLNVYTYVPYEKPIISGTSSHVTDERADVSRIAAQYPNMSLHFLNNQGKNCYEDLDTILDIMEIPFKACVNLPNLLEIYETASETGCSVMLSGQYGNSTVSHGYIDDVLYDLCRKGKYVSFLRYLNHYCRHVKESRKMALRGCFRFFRKARNSIGQLPDKIANPFVRSELFAGYSLKDRLEEGGFITLDTIPIEQKLFRQYLYRPAVLTYLGEMETKMGLACHMVLRDPTRDSRMLQFCFGLPYEMYAWQGIPRWLIRGNMQDMLPQSILQDWMRYGVQNADWYARMLRDWDVLKPQIKNRLYGGSLKKYLNVEEIDNFMNHISEQPKMQLKYLLFLCVFYRFVWK